MRARWLKQKHVAAPLIIAAFLGLYWLTPFKRAVQSAERPVFAVGGLFFNAGKGIQKFWIGLSQGYSLQNTIYEQDKEIARLESENSRLRSSLNADNFTKDVLGALESMPTKVIEADVLSLSNISASHIIYINKGAKDGVSENLPVLSAAGNFIGKTSKVNASVATVLLATDSKSIVAAQTENNSNIQAIVKGNLGLSLFMELIPQDAEINVGDIVVTSVLEENTPPEIPIGKVAAVFYNEGELFKFAQLEPLMPVYKIRKVKIITQLPKE